MGSTHEPKKDPQWGGRSSGRGLNRNSIGMHIFFPVGVYITRQACNSNKPSEAYTTETMLSGTLKRVDGIVICVLCIVETHNEA